MTVYHLSNCSDIYNQESPVEAGLFVYAFIAAADCEDLTAARLRDKISILFGN